MAVPLRKIYPIGKLKVWRVHNRQRNSAMVIKNQLGSLGTKYVKVEKKLSNLLQNLDFYTKVLPWQPHINKNPSLW